MHISCATDTLVQGVAAVERAVSSSDTQPILTGILLEAVNGNLRLTATDRSALKRLLPQTSRRKAPVSSTAVCFRDGA